MSANEIHVVAAVIEDEQGRFLLTERTAGRDLAGLWEFPGGKIEPGESPRRALCRELDEELGMQVEEADLMPLIRVRQPHAGAVVDLDVWRVRAYRGQPAGREAQALRWEHLSAMGSIAMPEADRPVLTALRLPDRYLITPEPGPDAESFLAQLQRALDQGVRLVQLRAPLSDPETLPVLAREVGARCRAAGAQWLINTDWTLAMELGADGVHLPARYLWVLQQRPLPVGRLLAVSCHDSEELAMAEALGADFVSLSPVKATPSHSDAEPLGWAGFAELRAQTRLPVFALGGMSLADLAQAKAHGAHGIAAIRALWSALG